MIYNCGKKSKRLLQVQVMVRLLHIVDGHPAPFFLPNDTTNSVGREVNRDK